METQGINNNPNIRAIRILIEQLDDLERRTKKAIECNSDGLANSLAFEYAKLVGDAFICSLSDNALRPKLLILKSEINLIPQPTKNDPLLKLKWVENSIPKLRILSHALISSLVLDLKLHPKVDDATQELLRNGHYSQAIFAAFAVLEEYVRQKTQREEYGQALMSKVFDKDKPVLKIKASSPESAKDEQDGFRLLFMGVICGLKNPRSHHVLVEPDLNKTSEYLSLASMLFKIVDESEFMPKSAEKTDKV